MSWCGRVRRPKTHAIHGVGACEAHAFETHETQSTRAAVSTRMAWLAGARPDALQAREASPPKKSTLMARSRSWPSQPPYSELRNSRKERRCARRCDHARHAANQVTYRRYRRGEPKESLGVSRLLDTTHLSDQPSRSNLAVGQQHTLSHPGSSLSLNPSSCLLYTSPSPRDS